MADPEPTEKGKQKPPFRGAAFRPMRGHEHIRFSDDEFMDAVFSGGYYIVLTNGENTSHILGNTTHVQSNRNRKKEEVLRLANAVKDITEKANTVGGNAMADEKPMAIQGSSREYDSTLRDRLLSDLQVLINKSNYNNTDFDSHLAHELDIARTQVLRGGAIDDFALMQTLQEIASIQGLSVAGTSMRGRFASDIMNDPEPEGATPQTAALHNDSEEFSLSDLCEYDQFSAYSIREVGGLRHRPSYFFAKKVMASILNINAKQEQEQSSAEITP